MGLWRMCITIHTTLISKHLLLHDMHKSYSFLLFLVTNTPFRVMAAISPCNEDGSCVSLLIIDLLMCNRNTITGHDSTSLSRHTGYECVWTLIIDKHRPSGNYWTHKIIKAKQLWKAFAIFFFWCTKTPQAKFAIFIYVLLEIKASLIWLCLKILS